MDKQIHPPFDVTVQCGDLGFVITVAEFLDNLWKEEFVRRMTILADPETHRDHAALQRVKEVNGVN